MAWQRTALGVGGVGALLLRSGVTASAVVGAAGLLAALGLLVLTERRYEWILQHVEANRAPSHPMLMRAVAATVAVLGLAAALLVVLPRP